MRHAAPFTKFGQTRMVNVHVYVNGDVVPSDGGWDAEVYIERAEDWYAFEAADWRDRRIRVVTPKDWANARQLEARDD